VVVCAYFGARGVSEYVAARYVGEATAAERPVRRAPAVTPTAPQKNDHVANGAAFTERNMFCSGCESSEAEPALQVAAAGDVVPDTNLPLHLVSTAVSTDPSGSFATVVNTQSSHKGAFWTGQKIPGAGEIKSVTGRWIDFVNPASNRVERLRLDRPPAPAPAPTETASITRRPNSRASARAQLEAEIASKVKAVGDNTWEVDRSIFDFLKMNPRATRGIRVLPSIKDGKANGFRITRLSSSSPVSKIGVQRGDVLTSVNGTALTGPDKVLAMMTQLNTLNRVVVTVERRGKPVELTYLLR
jgi:general secretion pathway protein C